MVASVDDLFEGYGYDGPGVCLGDGQTEAERVPSQGGRGDALLRRMSSYLTDLIPTIETVLNTNIRDNLKCSYMPNAALPKLGSN